MRWMLWLTLAILIGAALSTLWLAYSSRPAIPLPAPTVGAPLPASPAAELSTIIAQNETLLSALTPTPKNTPRPTRTAIPTFTPIPLCSEDRSGICNQMTATPTKTPRPPGTAYPTVGPCGVPGANGGLPTFCNGSLATNAPSPIAVATLTPTATAVVSNKE